MVEELVKLRRENKSVPVKINEDLKKLFDGTQEATYNRLSEHKIDKEGNFLTIKREEMKRRVEEFLVIKLKEFFKIPS